MVGKSLSTSALARLLGVKRSEVHTELQHVLMSLKHTGLAVEITPGHCRKCGFTFSTNELRKPSRCPKCRSTWIADPKISVREKHSTDPEIPPQPEPQAELENHELCEGVELMEHTADAGLIVTGRTIPELFERAAKGMFLILADLSAVAPVQSECIELTSDDLETLLINWLSELNYRHVVHRMLYCRFEVLEVASARLLANVSGEPIDLKRHILHTEIKAVTRHGLKIVETESGYRAEVLFDL